MLDARSEIRLSGAEISVRQEQRRSAATDVLKDGAAVGIVHVLRPVDVHACSADGDGIIIAIVVAAAGCDHPAIAQRIKRRAEKTKAVDAFSERAAADFAESQIGLS